MGGFFVTFVLTGVFFILFIFSSFVSCSVSSLLSSSCKLQTKFNLNEMHKHGDVVLGGLFEVHYTSAFSEKTFTSEPQQPHCTG